MTDLEGRERVGRLVDVLPAHFSPGAVLPQRVDDLRCLRDSSKSIFILLKPSTMRSMDTGEEQEGSGYGCSEVTTWEPTS